MQATDTEKDDASKASCAQEATGNEVSEFDRAGTLLRLCAVAFVLAGMIVGTCLTQSSMPGAWRPSSLFLATSATSSSSTSYHYVSSPSASSSVGAGTTAMRAPPSIGKPACPLCACRIETSTAIRPPVAMDPWAAPDCDVDALEPCFEEVTIDQVALSALHTIEKRIIWNESYYHTQLSKDVKQSVARDCSRPGLLVVGDSHMQLRLDQLYRIFHRHIYAATHWAQNFLEVWPVLKENLQQAMCATDIIVVCLATLQYAKLDYKSVLDDVLDLAKTSSLAVVLFPDDVSLEDGPAHCIRQTPPTSCASTWAGNSLRFLQHPKYAQNPRLQIIHDTEWICPNGKCDVFIPGTRTIGYRDRQHRNFVFQRYLQPFMCSELHRRGLL